MFHEDYFQKTLRWCEPHNGWGDHHNYRFAPDIRKMYNDTGFCNRLLHWELAYIISKKIDSDYKILLQYQHWPELDLLDLPNTFTDYPGITERNDLYLNFDYELLRFKTVFNVRKQSVEVADPITKDMLTYMFDNNDFSSLLESNHWHANFGFQTMGSVDVSWYKESRPISRISLKHKNLEDILANTLHNVVGIHLRRFNGVTFTEENYNDVPTELKNDWKQANSKKRVSSTEYEYHTDTAYFEIMDKMLKINPSQKFYISTDMPVSFLKPFQDRYGNKIIHNHLFEHDFVTYLHNANIDVVRLQHYANAITNVIDLFALANCPFVIGVPHSTWSEFAYHYKQKYHCQIMDSDDLIVNQYKNYIDNKSNFSLRSI